MIKIRQATPDDAKRLSYIEKLCFLEPWSERMLCETLRLENAYFFAAEHNQRLVGYAGFCKIIDEAHIANVGVINSYRRQGIGKSLVQKMIDCANQLNIGSMTLEVRQSNQRAQSLYKSLGFDDCGIRPNYYDNENAVIMWKQLAND